MGTFSSVLFLSNSILPNWIDLISLLHVCVLIICWLPVVMMSQYCLFDLASSISRRCCSIICKALYYCHCFMESFAYWRRNTAVIVMINECLRCYSVSTSCKLFYCNAAHNRMCWPRFGLSWYAIKTIWLCIRMLSAQSRSNMYEPIPNVGQTMYSKWQKPDY